MGAFESRGTKRESALGTKAQAAGRSPRTAPATAPPGKRPNPLADQPSQGPGRFRSGRIQARVAQNPRRTVAPRAGSWSIHQWPTPSRATVLASSLAAALVAEAALTKGSSLGMITHPGPGNA